MNHWNKNNTIFIMASKGYARRNIEDEDVKVFSPYHGDTGLLRICREICFRIPFLPKHIWYNKAFLNGRYAFIIIIDVNITTHYLNWIKKGFPAAKLIFLYNNMVGNARNIPPSKIPFGIQVWTYDDYDARRYSINLLHNYWISDNVLQPKKEFLYDVFFVGRDKGRGEALCKLEKKMKSMGLRTKFIITKDKKLSRRKRFYEREIPYNKVIEYDTVSRAILNITMENQEGVTMRDIEATAIGVKLITTNRSIINKDLYNKNNVFILGVDDIETLPVFLKREYVNVWDDIKGFHTFDSMLTELTN